MESFRTELENIDNPVVARDIIDLDRKIALFKDGKIDEEKFRSLRLARGVYGQRQQGVQMIRIKLPMGRITTTQLRRIADISTAYGSANLHATTRQDIQLHYVSLDRTPELWAKLEQDDITLREACGNTVRNITASPTAGIDPNELFDVTPYADAMFRYFLRNPICQEMGRKFKIAFSSTEEDTAFTFIHDIGLIPKMKGAERGFKVVIGGGLGSNPLAAVVAYEFLATDKIIPFAESLLRVFDRYGERNRRMKARFKFLLKDLGLEAVLALVEKESAALAHTTIPIDADAIPSFSIPEKEYDVIDDLDHGAFQLWKATNVFEQKQSGYFGVYVKLPLGDMSAAKAHQFADIIDRYASNELRITVNQGYLLRYVNQSALPHLFLALKELNLADPGFDSVADITSCPGTDSCNLGISNSTAVSLALENVVKEEFPELIHNLDIKIKLSGCPNSCGQHGLASIGFHGSSIKDTNGNVLPALVVLLGGGKLKDGDGLIAEKIIKIPSKRGPEALRLLLTNYEENSTEGEYFHNYYARMGGRKYFYDVLKPLADVSETTPLEYIDWGGEDKYKLETAVGECAGVIIDLVSTLFLESEEKLTLAEEAHHEGRYGDAIYHSYSAFLNTAKALLLDENVKPSTHIQIVNDFQKKFVETGKINVADFGSIVLQMNKEKPSESFASRYWEESKAFLEEVQFIRAQKNKLQAV